MSCGRMKVRGSLSLLQGISPTQGSNPGLPHRRWISHQLSHLGRPFEMPRIDKLIETERLGRDLDSRPSRGNCAQALFQSTVYAIPAQGCCIFPPSFPSPSSLLTPVSFHPSLPSFFVLKYLFLFIYSFGCTKLLAAASGI